MSERLLLVSTCGTSLLTNGASDADHTWLTRIANDIEVDSQPLMSIVNERRDRLKTADAPTRRRMSAELNGIGAVLDRYEPTQLFHLLVHTDNAPGKADLEETARRSRTGWHARAVCVAGRAQLVAIRPARRQRRICLRQSRGAPAPTCGMEQVASLVCDPVTQDQFAIDLSLTRAITTFAQEEIEQ